MSYLHRGNNYEPTGFVNSEPRPTPAIPAIVPTTPPEPGDHDVLRDIGRSAPPLYIDLILTKLQSIEDRLARMEEMNAKATGFVQTVGEQIMPTIEALMDHPMIAMLLSKGSRKVGR